MKDIFSNFLDEFHTELEKSSRSLDSVDVVAVSKKQPIERVKAALEYGHKVYGENRVQEALSKWPSLLDLYKDVSLHLIGPLQTNKVKQAVQLFDVIETLDREKLARALQGAMEEEVKTKDLFVQVNVGEESQKAGVSPQEVSDFIPFCRDELKLPVRGLMCIPPQDESPAPYFALLKKIADEHELPNVSMGMSKDFPLALALGATHIRVGTAFFGERE